MRSFCLLASGMTMLLSPLTAHAVDCSPFRPDAPVAQSAETEIKAEVGGLLSKLVEVNGEYRVADAKRTLGAEADDPDALVRWQGKLYYICEALNEDQTISTRDRIEIMRGLMDANSDARLSAAIKDDIRESQTINATEATLEACVINNRTLNCDFIVETSETEKQITVFATQWADASRLIDNQGNSYLASKIDLGGREETRFIQTNLPPDVPMRGRLTFENISNRATSAALLEIRGKLDGQDVPTFEIRDVSFE